MKTLHLTDLVGTRPLNDEEVYLMSEIIRLTIERDAGKSTDFIVNVGDKVMDVMTGIVSEVYECYRQNGHNFYNIDPKKVGGVREKDLIVLEKDQEYTDEELMIILKAVRNNIK